ncbi:MAG: stage III sporulation protein AF [Clostridia bacterium]|nr:stage III sporulation protein AF [Clostridia bacterium]
MESISIWIAELCVCAAAVSLAEQLLPEGNVKKAVYFVMGLMIVTSFVSPITHMEKLEFSKPDNSLTLNENTDWFNRITEDLFQKEVEKIIK